MNKGISMAAFALNLKTMKTHPWEDIMESFERTRARNGSRSSPFP